MRTSARTDDRAANRVLGFFQRLFDGYHPRRFTLRLWNGSEWPAEVPEPDFVWIIRRPGSARRMFSSLATNASLGESYVYGDFEIEGDLEAAFDAGDWLERAGRHREKRWRLAYDLLALPRGTPPLRRPLAASLEGRVHSRQRDRRAVTFHYDRSNEFFALWLDRDLNYSCAYFENEDDDLDTAQRQKLEHVARKLRLEPGEHILDVGCGWGGFLLHAARHHGVFADGITLSEAQASYAKRAIDRAGLRNRCRVAICDYRDAPSRGRYDKLVSVGMVEHVGDAQLATYFRKAWESLEPGGAFLNHGIDWKQGEPRPSSPTFDKRYIFPDSKLVSLHEMVRSAETAGFEVRDVESLREHYALTLRHWLRRLDARRDDVVRLLDEPTYRAWRLYLAGAAHGFAVGRLNVHQTLLVKPDRGRARFPLTRRDLYVPSRAPTREPPTPDSLVKST